ncbi:MAG: bifunctional demethylmenaquinone methyltransferase/2-methoxy-6-polyprenyl-1,4-benzoquinol methylase UbiE [Bacteroidia bacterium]|nr:bifunctional demethylmenaquinone methyltransferase/2-methoxy-6-polyprenyl-1,4-benzoquinol methylase UbiE [Bacteroidia bacterium]
MTVTPYSNSGKGKKEQVAYMFDSIARRYDFLNHFLSFGIDRSWRKKAIKILEKYSPEKILDIATGTGDFAIAACKLKPKTIIGIDISVEMLKAGKDKIRKKHLEHIIELKEGDAENIQANSNYFDAAIVAFGVRNFENIDTGLKEIARVLKQNAPVVILEFSKPGKFPFKQIYWLYSYGILPFLGKVVSSDKSAYTYLPKSIREFPDGKNFLDCLDNAGFRNLKQIPLTFGIASVYLGHKAYFDPSTISTGSMDSGLSTA